MALLRSSIRSSIYSTFLCNQFLHHTHRINPLPSSFFSISSSLPLIPTFRGNTHAYASRVGDSLGHHGGGVSPRVLVCAVLDLYRKAIKKKKKLYIPRDLMARDCGVGQYATINCDGRRIGGTRYQVGVIGRCREAKVLWLNNQQTFGFVGHVKGDDNQPADGLSKFGNVKHGEICANCRLELVEFQARVEGWFERKGKHQVVEGADYEAHVDRFKKLILKV